jgi:hypothetical protein
VGLIRSKTAEKPARPAHAGTRQCQACRSTDTDLEHLMVAPETVVDRCVDPRTCRERAQKLGTWKTYP